MVLISGEFPSHSRTGISLHSRNVLVLFKVMAWREIMNKGIPLLWEHNAFTCHFNIMNYITLIFCTIDVTSYFSQKRQGSVFNGSPDLHSYYFCTLTGGFTVV